MFIDNVTLLLIGTAASYMTIAGYLFFGINDSENQSMWAAAFGIVGGMLVAAGFYVIWLWPLPGAFNMAYGEMSILLGVMMVGACWSLVKGVSLLPLSIPAFFFGGVALVMAYGFYKLGMTPKPVPTAIGFAVSGICGVLAFVPLAFRKQQIFRIAGGLVCAAVSLFWAYTAYMGYFGHLTAFAKYLPAGMK